MTPKNLSQINENSNFPIFKTSGTNYEVGLEVGRKFKQSIKKAFRKSPLYIALKLMDKTNPKWFDQLQIHAQKFFPQYVEEMRGIAEGAEMKYRDIAIVNFRHSIKIFDPKAGCSTVIFKNDDSIVLAHNEDHERILRDYSYLLIVKYEKGPTIFTYCYPGCIPGNSISFNTKGLVMSGNAMPDPDLKTGLPKGLLDRAIAEASNIEEALHLGQRSDRSGAYSYNLASLYENKAVNLEITSKKSCVTLVDGIYFHTNHYISGDLKHIQVDNESNYHSEERFKRGSELLPRVKNSSEGALEIVSDNEVFVPMSKVMSSSLGDVYGGTHLTALFDLSKDNIKLQIYPYVKNRAHFMQFTLEDLNV